MDGENNGKPYEQMDDLGGFPIIFGSTPISDQESECFEIHMDANILTGPRIKL